jgi:tRNA(Ile)-lysidine synthase
MVLEQFQSNIIKKQLFTKRQSLLLAISGGADSVVLAHLLKKCGYQFSLAHCNFKLRGNDSDKDEKFCRELAGRLGVKIFVREMNVPAKRAETGASVQMAARELRYKWFGELMKDHGFDLLVTAHHGSDAVETLFINLLRGTGIKGLKGIAEKKENIVRPLLGFTKQEIEAYAKKNKIKFRLDKSNLEDKYERNFIRLNILPQLKKINLQAEQILLRNISNFKEESGIVDNYFEERKKNLLSRDGNTLKISRKEIIQEKHLLSLLNNLLSPYGFNASQCSDLCDLIAKGSGPGKKILSNDYALFVEREYLIIKPGNEKTESLQVNSTDELCTLPFLQCEYSPVSKLSKKEMILSAETLIFPLTVRPPATGDRFMPFGMKGSRLISDFLKDEKTDNSRKGNVRLLVNGNREIIWVMGMRSDERYRVKGGDEKYLKLTYIE